MFSGSNCQKRLYRTLRHQRGHSVSVPPSCHLTFHFVLQKKFSLLVNQYACLTPTSKRMTLVCNSNQFRNFLFIELRVIANLLLVCRSRLSEVVIICNQLLGGFYFHLLQLFSCQILWCSQSYSDLLQLVETFQSIVSGWHNDHVASKNILKYTANGKHRCPTVYSNAVIPSLNAFTVASAVNSE